MNHPNRVRTPCLLCKGAKTFPGRKHRICSLCHGTGEGNPCICDDCEALRAEFGDVHRLRDWALRNILEPAHPLLGPWSR